MFLLCFEVIGNDDSLSLAVCTCCLGNRLFAVFPRAFYGLLIAGLLPVSAVFMMLIFSNLPLRIHGEGGAVSWETYLRVKTANNWKEPVLRSI